MRTIVVGSIDCGDYLCHRLRDSQEAQRHIEDEGAADDEDDGAREHSGLAEAVLQHRPVETAKDPGEDESDDHAERRGLGRRR